MEGGDEQREGGIWGMGHKRVMGAETRPHGAEEDEDEASVKGAAFTLRGFGGTFFGGAAVGGGGGVGEIGRAHV